MSGPSVAFNFGRGGGERRGSDGSLRGGSSGSYASGSDSDDFVSARKQAKKGKAHARTPTPTDDDDDGFDYGSDGADDA